MTTFESLQVWQEARKLVQQVYQQLDKNKDFGFRDQVQRASMSVMNNIAEGYERAMLAEKLQFYRYAKGSVGEVRSMLYAGLDIGYFDQDFFDNLYPKLILMSQSLQNLIASLEKYKK